MRTLQRLTLILFVLVLLLFCGAQVYDRLFLDHTPPVIRSDSDVLEVSVNDPEEALLAGLTASDDRDGDLTGEIMIQSVSPLIGADTANIHYVVFDSSNNAAAYSRVLRYTDYRKPHFALSEPMCFKAGGPVTFMDRLTASDVIDGDLSGSIRVTAQNLAVGYEGTYSITVQVTNSLGDTAVLPLTVVLSNTGAQSQLVYLTDYVVYVDQGSSFDPGAYVQAVRNTHGASVSPDQLSVVSDVDTSVPGNYEVAYTYEGYTAYLAVVVE